MGELYEMATLKVYILKNENVYGHDCDDLIENTTATIENSRSS